MHYLVNGHGLVKGIKPADADDDSTHKVMKFKVLQASVKAYQRNLIHTLLIKILEVQEPN